MKPPFIVAEMSASHLGEKTRAIQIIEAAAYAGADACKFQCWTPGTMCLDKTYVLQDGPWAGRRLAELYEEAYTPWEWIPDLQEAAREHGIILFASVFDAGALEILEHFGCPMYKIASCELTDKALIERVAATGKPIMISCGMGTFEEISAAWSWAISRGCRDLCLLKCSSAYPAPESGINLATMEHMRKAFGGDKTTIGFSDHTQGIGAAIAAAVLGATVIEKHLTLSIEDGGLDAGFSIEPEEFAQMVSEVGRAVAAIGEKLYQPQEAEVLSLRRSLYASRAIACDESLTPENVATARPALGLPASQYSRTTNGTARARRALAPGEPIRVEDIIVSPHSDPARIMDIA
ncbi:MAG TPA: pseudaminic acid synthase [Xanthobacteraceae bacterium]|nr:pseudaminic acid synthase [Xanthobacteraceae bacterium]